MFLIFVFTLSIILYYFSKFFNFQNVLKNFTSSDFIKFILLISIMISFFINLFAFWIFIKCYYNSLNFFLYSDFYLNNNLFLFNIPLFNFLSYKTSIEFFGFIFILLAYIVGFISFLSLDTRLFNKNIKYILVCNFLVIIIHLFTIVNDLLLLFLFYESMLIPSFLFVYFVSPYRRGVQASIYFLI
jgi:formate hydrogenlyase subunit 3/multisubunit Na+/H+ antiporter MnhD subunit